MNFSDSESEASLLGEAGYGPTRDMETADLILIDTCSIREKAGDTVRKRLRVFDKVKQRHPGTMVGVLGCMAERLKAKFLDEEKLVDIVVGPTLTGTCPDSLLAPKKAKKASTSSLAGKKPTPTSAPSGCNPTAVPHLSASCGVATICVRSA